LALHNGGGDRTPAKGVNGRTAHSFRRGRGSSRRRNLIQITSVQRQMEYLIKVAMRSP
jgi:hypothetical protein